MPWCLHSWRFFSLESTHISSNPDIPQDTISLQSSSPPLFRASFLRQKSEVNHFKNHSKCFAKDKLEKLLFHFILLWASPETSVKRKLHNSFKVILIHVCSILLVICTNDIPNMCLSKSLLWSRGTGSDPFKLKEISRDNKEKEKNRAVAFTDYFNIMILSRQRNRVGHFAYCFAEVTKLLTHVLYISVNFLFQTFAAKKCFRQTSSFRIQREKERNLSWMLKCYMFTHYDLFWICSSLLIIFVRKSSVTLSVRHSLVYIILFSGTSHFYCFAVLFLEICIPYRYL